MNILDRMFAAVAPQYAVKRLAAKSKIKGYNRARMAYDAATVGHRASSWRPVNTDANNEIMQGGYRVRSASRDLIRNNAFAVRAKSAIINNMIGTGIIPSCESNNAATKARVEEALKRHFDTTACDALGQTNLYGIQAQIMGAVIESGAALVRRRVEKTASGIPLTLQVLEPDYLDQRVDGPLPNGNIAIQGIEIDSLGRAVSYWLFEQHPGSYQFQTPESKPVPAEFISHVRRIDRPGQLHGISWFAPVLVRLRDLSEFLDAHLVRQKIAACLAAFVTSELEPETTVDESDPSRLLETFEPGMIEYLRTGQDVKFSDPPALNDLPAYSRVTLLEIAAGLGISAEVLTGDMTAVNFSSGRMGWLEFQRSIDSWRSQMFQPQFLDDLGNQFSILAELTLGTKSKFKINWTAPRREMISPKDELPPLIEAIRAGITTRSEVVRRQGYDPEAIDLENAADNARADSLGLMYDSDSRYRADNGANTNQPEIAGANGE